MEADLAGGHVARLLEVVRGRVDDRQIVLLVPSAHISTSTPPARARTLDAVRLDELGAVDERGLRDGVPGPAGRHAEVDVRGGELVDVEPDVLRPRVLDQVLVSRGRRVRAAAGGADGGRHILSTLSRPMYSVTPGSTAARDELSGGDGAGAPAEVKKSTMTVAGNERTVRAGPRTSSSSCSELFGVIVLYHGL